MARGRSATMVITWTQTMIDGLPAGDPSELVSGATWRWQGEAVRLDGPANVLLLQHPEGAPELQLRAGRRARRLPGRAAAGTGTDRPEPLVADGSFAVSDGRHAYAVDMVEDPARNRMLLVFRGALPPRDTDLWISAVTAPPPLRLRGDDNRTALCFVMGTRVTTPAGPVAVENLAAGDMVMTRDSGAQPVLWIGHSSISGARLHLQPGLRPIRIRSGALGDGQPDGDLIVSPQHRVLWRGPTARALYNEDEVLIAAADLLDDARITRVRGLRRLDYYHLLLPRHHVIWANGVPAETFHPADGMPGADHDGVARALPGIARHPERYGARARRVLNPAEAALLRHDMPRLAL